MSNNVGSRQGCSWGSFCYCLALHGPLSTLAGEFPDLLVLAYADDVHIVGPPARAVKAYNRWVELYESELQGNLRPDKSVCFAPSVPLEEVAAAGLPVKSLECPSGMPVVHDGTRVLRAPVGRWVLFDTDLSFERNRVERIWIGDVIGEPFNQNQAFFFIFNKLLKNTQIKKTFLDRYRYFIEHVFDQNRDYPSAERPTPQPAKAC